MDRVIVSISKVSILIFSGKYSPDNKNLKLYKNETIPSSLLKYEEEFEKINKTKIYGV